MNKPKSAPTRTVAMRLRWRTKGEHRAAKLAAEREGISVNTMINQAVQAYIRDSYKRENEVKQ